MILNQHHKDLLSTLINQLWRLISGPLTMVLIPLYLSSVFQGYWYLFISLSALTVFADLGFSNIVMQFSAHEFAFLSFSDKGVLVGDDLHIKKMGSLLRFILKRISLIILIAFPVIYILGLWFFQRDSVTDLLILPWTIYSIGSLINFFNYSILSFIEGMNKIQVIENTKLIVSVVNTVVIALVLLMGGNIYALALGSLVGGSLIFVLFLGKFKSLLRQLLKASVNYQYDWNKEILPLFIRYALSFASGYFIFSIYTPLMQYYAGPIESGKVGITLTLIMAIFSLSNIWIYTITPQMNILVSQKNFKELNRLFKKRLLFSASTYLFILGCLILFYYFLKDFWVIPRIVSRFLSLTSIGMLVLCYFLQLLVNSWATYLRAFKKELYMVPSIILAFWVLFSTAFAGYYLKPEYFFIGFLSSYLWWLPLSFFIYKQFKNRINEQ